MMRRATRSRRKLSGGGVSGSAWTPASITSLIGWYDATSWTVATWSDLSGQGNHLAQNAGTTALTTTWNNGNTIAGGRSAVQFTGSQNFKSAAFVGGDATAPVTIFVLMDQSAAGSRTAFDGRAATKRYWGGQLVAGRGQCGNTNFTSSGVGTIDFTAPTVLHCHYGIILNQTTNAGSVSIGANGSMLANNVATGPPVTENLNGLMVGSFYDGSSLMTGRIHTLLVYDDNINGANFTTVLAWLQARI